MYSYQRTSEIDYQRLSERLATELQRLVKDAGKVLEAEAFEPAKGGGWIALFSTEYAALKVYYTYRKSNVNLDKNPKGWAVSVR